MENGQLKAFVERIERLEEEKKSIADDIKDIYAEAKGNGFDVKALRAIIKMRKQDAEERREQEAIVETYAHALGMLATTELGQAALARRHAELEQQGREIMDGLERTGSKTLGEAAEKVAKRVAASPAVQRAVKKFGKRVPLTPEEEAKGYTVAFEKDGDRVAMQFAPDDPRGSILKDAPGDIPQFLARNPDNTLPTTA